MKRTIISIAISVGLLTQTTIAQDGPREMNQSPPNPSVQQRIGVEAKKSLTLTLQEAMTMALENNREIEVQRLNVQLNEFDLQAARGAYDPTFSAGFSYEHRKTPVASVLAGSEDGSLKTTDFSGTTKIAKSTF